MKKEPNIIAKLRHRKNLSKYRIAKLTGVSWNTVRLWEREVFKPNKTNLAKLKKVLNEKQSFS